MSFSALYLGKGLAPLPSTWLMIMPPVDLTIHAGWWGRLAEPPATVATLAFTDLDVDIGIPV